MAKLQNGYQVEIDKTIKEAESLRKTIQSKDIRIERQSKRLSEFDRQANPQRYRLSSGVEFVRVNIANYSSYHPEIWIY